MHNHQTFPKTASEIVSQKFAGKGQNNFETSKNLPKKDKTTSMINHTLGCDLTHTQFKCIQFCARSDPYSLRPHNNC